MATMIPRPTNITTPIAIRSRLRSTVAGWVIHPCKNEAVSSAKAIQDDGKKLAPAEARAAKLAKEAVDKLPRDEK